MLPGEGVLEMSAAGQPSLLWANGACGYRTCPCQRISCHDDDELLSNRVVSVLSTPSMPTQWVAAVRFVRAVFL